MRKWVVFTVTALLLATQSHAEQPVQCDTEESGFRGILHKVSNVLSSTNPRVNKEKIQTEVPEQLNELSSASGNVPAQEKPLHMPLLIKPQPIPLPGAVDEDPSQVMELPPPVESMPEPKLSAASKYILKTIPSGVGNPRTGSAGRVDITRGGFDDYLDEPIDLQAQRVAQPAPEPKKSKFEITMVDVRPAAIENEVQIMEKALVAMGTGQYEGAIALYKSVLEKAPKNRDALFGLATAYHKADQRDQARVAYAKLIKNYPTYAEGLNNFLVFISDEAPQDALTEMEALSARIPNFAPIYAQKAVVYSRLQQDSKAAANLQRAIQLDPKNITYKYNLAVVYDKLNESAKAVDLYSEVLASSYKGADIPVDRLSIEERLTFLTSQKVVSSNVY